MHLAITLTPEKGLEIPIKNNHIIQAIIYNNIEPELANFLHENGYVSNNRKFKLFSFSRLMGNFSINKIKNTINYPEKINLIISSPMDKFCQSLANRILFNGKIEFGNKGVEVEKITVQQFKVNDERVVLRTLSPIVAYSTFLRLDGRKFTCYFQPGDPDYNALVEKNLRKKYQAYYEKEAPKGEVKVRKIGEMKQRVMSYKDIIIKGYVGKVALTGPKELLQIALDCGIGSKNSQGFGCMELVERR